MEEIEVGKYGRTNKGKIFIFAWLQNSDGKRYTNKVLLGNGKIIENKFYYFDNGEKIVKHSKNLIDLIEEGDVLEIEDEGCEEKYECLKGNEGLSVYISIYDCYRKIEDLKIKKILTKEQYEENSYKV